MKKYEFTGEEKVIDNHTLHRIRAMRDCGIVKAGDLGGWIEGGITLAMTDMRGYTATHL